MIALADTFRASQLDPGNIEIANRLGAILREAGPNEKALSVYERALQISPGGDYAGVLDRVRMELAKLAKSFAGHRGTL